MQAALVDAFLDAVVMDGLERFFLVSVVKIGGVGGDLTFGYFDI